MRSERWRDVGRRLAPEVAKFGAVGAVGFVVDVGGFNLLRYGGGGHGPLHDAPLTAKLISTVAATVVSWLGNRHWTFRHGRRAIVHHEFALFVVVCAIGAGLALACLATSHYLLDLRSPLADNISANGVGLTLGTIFRFWAYRQHVFTGHLTERPDRISV